MLASAWDSALTCLACDFASACDCNWAGSAWDWPCFQFFALPHTRAHSSRCQAGLFSCRCHQILANLRSGGSKEYKIPEGFAFNYITCANYFFEIWGWLLFGVATQTLAAFLFIAAGGFQMMQWALQKHKRLRKVGALSLSSVLYLHPRC